MTKTEYLESQRGLTYTEIVNNQPTEQVIGSIRGDNLRDVVDILAKGLQDRLDNASPSPLRTALLVVFKYLTLENYQINLSLPENAALLNNAVALGLVTQDEADKFFSLASYNRSIYSITRVDCINYFNPNWNEIEETIGRNLKLTLNIKAPEQTNLIVQYQDLAGDWYHATAIHGIQAAKPYTASLPFDGIPRKLRWKLEYALNADVMVV